MTQPIPRYLLEKFFGSEKRMLLAMSEHTQATADNVAATAALKDATVIVLSPNGDFDNARVLQVGAGIEIEIGDETVTLSVRDRARTENYTVTLLPTDNTVLYLPASSGTLLGTQNSAALPGSYASDTAAASAGVALYGFYLNGSVVQQRIA